MPPIHPSKIPGASSSKKSSRKLSNPPESSTSIKKSTHLRFDRDQHDNPEDAASLEEEPDANEEDESLNGVSSGSDEGVSSSSDQSDDDEDDDDAPPEVLSTVASKRYVVEKEKARKEFQQAAAVAKRQANKARDERLKQSKAQAKSRLPKPDPSSSSDEESDPEPTPSLPEPSSTNKKYLDPSLFASAAKVLEQSRIDAEALADTRNASIKKKRKRSQRLEEQDHREIGDNTFVVRLSKPTHLVPSTRPESVSKFVINRLSRTKSRGSPLSLSKTTRTAKTDLGSRKRTTLATTGSRKTNRPAAVFVRQPN